MFGKIVYYIVRVAAVMVVMTAVAGCQSINDLSGDNSVYQFDVERILTEDVVMEAERIDNDSSVVWLRLDYGRHRFPISADVAVCVAEGARVVEPLDSVRFEDEDAAVCFHVMAANGATREWNVKLHVTERSSDANLLKVNVSTEARMVSREAVIMTESSAVMIFAPEAEFPLTLALECMLADSARMEGYENGSEMVFADYQTAHGMTVVAADGLEKKWTVMLTPGTAITDNTEVGWSVWRDVSLQQSKTRLTASAALARTDVDDEENFVRGILPEGVEWAAAVDMTLESETPDYVEWVGYEPGSEYTQAEAADTLVFYLFDRVRMTCKRWTAYVTEWLSDRADVDSVALLQSSPSGVVIDYHNVLVDSAEAWVLLPILRGEGLFPLSVKLRVMPVEGAEVAGGEEMSITFADINDTRQVTVKAEDGSERTWTIGCTTDVGEESMARVLSVRPVNYTSKDDRMELAEYAEIKEDSGIIEIQIVDWAEYMPLTVALDMALSYGATVTEADFTVGSPLTFNTLEDRYGFTVQSGNGGVTADYTIRLSDLSAGRHSQAELLSFRVTEPSSGYTVDEVRIDTAWREVAVVLSSAGSGVFAFVPRIEVSPGAVLDGIRSGAAFSFGSIESEHTFYVVSEDGSVRNEWRLTARFEPQIGNSDFEAWSSNTTPEVWATANNIVNTTMKDAHGSGFCAKILTSSAMGKPAAGSLFLGKFDMSNIDLSNPRSMTWFGVPFTARPESISFDYKYTQVDGDMGSVVVELLNYEGSDIEYHGFGTEPGVTVLYRGAADIGVQSAWQRMTVPIGQVSSSGLDITHLHVVFSSSKNGDKFEGGVGSTLWIDNVTLDYEE
ncbi:MAG: PCMD domain-containing protein [bacterium]|uniref:PCMD domain-containing protein n=1 Tax=Candidatus Aphodosoma intestinipullorum TaxID=2840674 RepID=A0A940DIB1_9BACT|nr:PCMD domain-containing protein [Candidatus Aphodosoma intestinipullorum]